jgi:hypothetical protein
MDPLETRIHALEAAGHGRVVAELVARAEERGREQGREQGRKEAEAKHREQIIKISYEAFMYERKVLRLCMKPCRFTEFRYVPADGGM